MNKIISTEKIPIKLWLDDIEEGALEQAKNLANLPFAFKHVAIMPDAHQGFGMCIGGVVALQGAICPSMVGVDIGCGMCSVKTSLKEIDKETLKKIMGEIRKVIPVGFSHQEKEQDTSVMPKVEKWIDEGIFDGAEYKDLYPVVSEQYLSALKQLGTLGSGNHFIEIQKGSDGFIWIMIHSGSRNLGKRVADYYNHRAQIMNRRWFSQVPSEWGLAFLPTESDIADDYLREMQYCVDFALTNRKLMMDRVLNVISNEFARRNTVYKSDEENFNEYKDNNDFLLFSEMINIAHNYVKLENHFEKNVWVHRKGATLARKDTIGIIPGSQGTKSYIVKGLGNPESFMSCSHGAGRKMSRTAARKDLDLKTEVARMDVQGIIHGLRNQKDLDEASGAYKDIDIVMKNQQDLVEVLVELSPLAVIKG